MDEELLNEEREYKSQIFFDGDVLTADDMNNVITGIDESLKRVTDLSEISLQEFENIHTQVDSIESNITGIDNKVPNLPYNEGQYFLSGNHQGGLSYYEWVKNDPIMMFRDPDNDGRIIIGEEDPVD